MSRTLLPALCASLVALLAAACASGVSVSRDYDPAADFSAYHTWSWLPQPVPEVVDPRIHNQVVDQRVRKAVERALAAKGYEKVSQGTGDFGVGYHAAIEGKVSVQTINEDYGYGPVWGPAPSRGSLTRTYVREYDEGTLILDVVDTPSRKLVWRASAQAEVSQSAAPEERDKRVQQAVDQMLSEFPPH